MGKAATKEQNIGALEIFKKYGIYVQAGHILFDYGTTISELEENFEFMRKYIWTISKGIFTEMYAADGTPLKKFLSNKKLLKLDEKGLGNNTYDVQDPDAKKAYRALKLWHKSHIKVYDMAIDPISAPKALEFEELELFHALSISLREKDLGFMRRVLDWIEDGISEEKLLECVSDYVEYSRDWYQSFEIKVLNAYGKTRLIYDADENPFID